MNIRTIVFSGIMTAIIGGMIGLAVGHISERKDRQKIIMYGGAVLGFVIGSAQEGIRQQSRMRDRDDG